MEHTKRPDHEKHVRFQQGIQSVDLRMGYTKCDQHGGNVLQGDAIQSATQKLGCLEGDEHGPDVCGSHDFQPEPLIVDPQAYSDSQRHVQRCHIVFSDETEGRLPY